MIRPRLLVWQWSDYAVKHRSRVNLLLHPPAAEQWITFPRFVLSGGWYRALTQSRA